MGMSASQARLLSITSRMNDIELRSQQISNTKIRLADESEQVANDYNKALNASKLTYTTFNTETQSMQTVDLTPKNLSKYGLCLVQRSDNSVFSGDVTPAQMYEMIESGQFFLAKAGQTTTTAPTLKNSQDLQVINKFNQANNINDISKTARFTEVSSDLIVNDANNCKKAPSFDFWDEVEFEDTPLKTYLQNPEEVSVSGNTFLSIQSDDTNLAKAEAEYNAKTAKINSKEKKLDQQMKEMDTEHNALKTEYDSVKSLISDNISKSFQLFS